MAFYLLLSKKNLQASNDNNNKHEDNNSIIPIAGVETTACNWHDQQNFNFSVIIEITSHFSLKQLEKRLFEMPWRQQK